MKLLVLLSLCAVIEGATTTTSAAGKQEACPAVCGEIWKPVCGMDGDQNKTFSSDCKREKENCEAKKNYRKVFEGTCEIGPLILPVKEEQECATFCTQNYAPVCADVDGKEVTFSNDCSLSVFNCEKKRDYRVKRVGSCSETK